MFQGYIKSQTSLLTMYRSRFCSSQVNFTHDCFQRGTVIITRRLQQVSKQAPTKRRMNKTTENTFQKPFSVKTRMVSCDVASLWTFGIHFSLVSYPVSPFIIHAQAIC